MPFFLIIPALCWLSLAAAVPYNSIVLPPSLDPWYTTPEDFESASPGAVLRLRHAPGNLTAITGAAAAYNILYRTTDSRLEPSWAVTTVFVPDNATGEALLSHQFPYNSPSIDASPSYAMYSNPFQEVTEALGRGWYVSVPDHESYTASFTAERGQGFATLDSVRAVRGMDIGLKSDAKYAMMGYSGGSLATEWAAELQPLYAPELDFAGAALGGCPVNVTDGALRASGTQYAGLVALATIGVTRPYPGAFEFLKSRLVPENMDTFLEALDMDAPTAFDHFFEEDMWEKYFLDGSAYLDLPEVQAITDENWLVSYTGTPRTPLFVYHAIQDELANVDLLKAVVERYCLAHVDILMELNEAGHHIDEMTNGMPRAFDWLSSVLDGKDEQDYPKKGCATRVVNIDLSS